MTATHPSIPRFRLALAGLAMASAGCGLLAACGSSASSSASASTTTTKPAPATTTTTPKASTFCKLEGTIEGRFGQAFSSTDPSNQEALVAALKTAATDLHDQAAQELQLAPASLHDSVQTLIAGVDKAAQGDPSDFETNAYHQASTKVDRYCDLPGVSD